MLGYIEISSAENGGSLKVLQWGGDKVISCSTATNLAGVCRVKTDWKQKRLEFKQFN